MSSFSFIISQFKVNKHVNKSIKRKIKVNLENLLLLYFETYIRPSVQTCPDNTIGDVYEINKLQMNYYYYLLMVCWMDTFSWLNNKVGGVGGSMVKLK